MEKGAGENARGPSFSHWPVISFKRNRLDPHLKSPVVGQVDQRSTLEFVTGILTRSKPTQSLPGPLIFFFSLTRIPNVDETITMPPPTYIISRVADPVFAVFIGLSAAVTRVRREEKEKGRTSAETMDAFKR